MPDATKNNTTNVSTGKGVAGGYMYVAPYGTAMPTDNATELDTAFKNMGFLGEDGINFSDSSDSTAHTDMNGDTVDTSSGAIEKTFTVVLIEIKKDTLAVIQGSDNVTDTDGMITAHDKGVNEDVYAVVFELLLKNGRKWRRCVHQCKLGELGDLSISYSDLVGREITLSTLKDETSGDYYTDYIDSTETTAQTLDDIQENGVQQDDNDSSSQNSVTESNTVAEIDTYAAENGIDLSGARTKAQKLNIINGGN